MRKIILSLLVVLFFIGFVSALDCKYRVNESYKEFGNWLYDSDGNYFGEPLILKDFVSEYMNIDGCSPVPSFKIYNQYDFPVTLSINYTLFHPRINQFYPESERQMGTEVEINPYSEKRIDSTCLDIGTNQVLEESIVYTISGDKSLILKKGDRVMQREICKLCGNEICLDDATSCNPLYDDSKCGSGICNIAGFCGYRKVVDCPNGKINCQDKTCLESSTKKVGESYSCEWECISQVGDGNICVKNADQIKKESDARNKSIAIFIVVLFIVALLSYWFIKKRGADEAGRQKDKIDGEVKELMDKKKKLQGEIEKSNDAIQEIKERLESMKGKEKKILQEKLEKEIKNRNSIAEKLKETIKKEIEAALIKYGRRYGRENIRYDKDSGYIKFVKGDEPIHRYIYRRKFNLAFGYKVHHIDNDKLNNEIWNLLSLSEEEHKKLNHARIDFGNWGSGIEQLKEQLGYGTNEKPFPEHIWRKIKEGKNER